MTSKARDTERRTLLPADELGRLADLAHGAYQMQSETQTIDSQGRGWMFRIEHSPPAGLLLVLTSNGKPDHVLRLSTLELGATDADPVAAAVARLDDAAS